MQKNDLIEEVQRQLAAGSLSEQELLELIAADAATPQRRDSVLASRLSVILYYVGGGIVFLGMVFLIAQEWDQFPPWLKIFVTLGSGIAAFVVGVLLSQHEKLGAAGPAFFLLSAMLLPGGILVAYDEAGVNVDALPVLVQISGILAAVYIGAYLTFRQTVLLVFGILFSTWFFFMLTSQLASGAPIYERFEFVTYRILFAGLCYMFLGHAFSGTDREVLTGWLYGIGVVAFLGAGFALGEWKPNQNVFWEAIYPGLVFAVIFLSTYLKSRTFLVFGSLALGSFLVKITAEYFEDSIGWPASLVLMGFMLMGVAYLAVRIKRHYLSI